MAHHAARADVLGVAPPGMLQDRGMELELESGDAHIPRSRPLKRLSDGELAELRANFVDLLYRGSTQHSTVGHAADRVRSQAGRVVAHLLRLSQPQRHHDYRGLNSGSTARAVELLQHNDALLDGTRGLRFFTKLDQLSSAAGAGLGQVEDKLSVAARPVRVECGPFRSAGSRGVRNAGQVHMDDCLVHSLTLEQHLFDV